MSAHAEPKADYLTGFLDPLLFEQGDRIEVSVSIGSKKYILAEADGAAINAFNVFVFRSAKFDDNGKFRPGETMAEANFHLLGACLLDGETRAPVGVQFAQSLPNRISKPLIERLKRISGMEDPPKGKDAAPSTSGSS